MGIYIKGIDMPDSCRDCRFCNDQADTDYGVCAWCDVDGNARDAYTMQDCPLVPVPPHGRLGDLDALIADISFFDGGDWHYGYSAKQIEAAPTIIPADPGKEET